MDKDEDLEKLRRWAADNGGDADADIRALVSVRRAEQSLARRYRPLPTKTTIETGTHFASMAEFAAYIRAINDFVLRHCEPPGGSYIDKPESEEQPADRPHNGDVPPSTTGASASELLGPAPTGTIEVQERKPHSRREYHYQKARREKVLKLFEDAHTYEEIAEACQCSVATVKRDLRRLGMIGDSEVTRKRPQDDP